MSSYRIVFSKQDLGYRISTLYRQKQFSIGILDFGTKEDLVSALDWYLANMNLSIHVLSTEFNSMILPRIILRLPSLYSRTIQQPASLSMPWRMSVILTTSL